MGLVGFESAPRYRELLYKLISEDLEFAPPGFIVENDRLEYSFLKDEIRFCSQNFTVGAIAAQSGFVQALNPVGSGRIVTITDYNVVKVAAGNVTMALTTTVRGVTGNAFPVALDTRFNTPIVPTAALVARDPVSISTGTSVAFGSDVPVTILGHTAGASLWVPMLFPKVILAPGTGVVLSDITLNEAFGASFIGYSRVARPEELVP